MTHSKRKHKKDKQADRDVGVAESDRQEATERSADSCSALGAAPGADAEAAPDESIRQLDEPARLKEEVEQWKDKFLRAKAEQQNAARRAAAEQSEAIRYCNERLLRALLDVVDDLGRTVEASQTSDTNQAVLGAVKLIQEKLEKLLNDNHVRPIDAHGQPFDPARHQALMQQPSPDHKPGTVVQQVQRGYSIHDRVLRPAKVIVAAAPQDQAGDDEEAVTEGEDQQGI